MSNDDVSTIFRHLIETADKKFARVRDLPLHATTRGQNATNFHKVFKAYTKLWKFQQENRRGLIDAGLNRWEIGEIASRIGQLYYSQYMRSSEIRFLIGAYVFYEAILSRRYFEGSGGGRGGRGVRFKELRFYARFLMVALLMRNKEMVEFLLEKFGDVVEDSIASFPETSFKEWKLVLQEVIQFNKSDSLYLNTRPLRYSSMLDSYPSSQLYVNRFHAKKVLKFRDAVLTSYHKNEVRFTEQTLDTFRMLQCLEWEPTGPISQKHPIELRENGGLDHSVTSGLIDMHLAADMTDPNLPPNPKKAILYRPAVTQLLAVIASVCAELPPESVMLIYLSASGKGSHIGTTSHVKGGGNSRRSSKLDVISHKLNSKDAPLRDNNIQQKQLVSQNDENRLWLGPCRDGGTNFLYPDDMIPFTRRPLFLIIDSDNSHAFKVLHGAERGETAALLLSPLKPSHKNPGSLDGTQNGSQFTFFLAAPLQAFCELVGLNLSKDDHEVLNEADSIISTAFAEWEVTLCTSTSIELAWAQVLSDPLLRRLILRFIFCRAVLTLFCLRENSDQYLPICLPELPDHVTPHSEVVLPSIIRLANCLGVARCFRFHGS